MSTVDIPPDIFYWNRHSMEYASVCRCIGRQRGCKDNRISSGQWFRQRVVSAISHHIKSHYQVFFFKRCLIGSTWLPCHIPCLETRCVAHLFLCCLFACSVIKLWKSSPCDNRHHDFDENVGFWLRAGCNQACSLATRKQGKVANGIQLITFFLTLAFHAYTWNCFWLDLLQLNPADSATFWLPFTTTCSLLLEILAACWWILVGWGIFIHNLLPCWN